MNKTNKRIWLSGFAIIVFFAAVFGLHRLLQEPAGTYTAEACFQDLRRKLGRERRQVRQQFR